MVRDSDRFLARRIAFKKPIVFGSWRIQRRWLAGMVLAAACCVAFAPHAARAQRTTATLFGQVEDQTGAVIPSASVRVRNTATGVASNAVSDGSGRFTFPFLPVGTYSVTVTAHGFAEYRLNGLSLNAGQQLRLPVKLQVKTSTQQVIVTTQAPLIQNGAATQQDTISRQQIAELPQSKRDFTSLLTLQNGVQSIGQGLFQLNGLAAGGMSVTVDGVDASGDPETPSTSMFQGFNLINVMSEDAIQEVTVSSGVMSAEVARTFSGNINIISKGGGNQFHGSLFELFQNDVLNARNALLSPSSRKPPVRFNQYGGSLGGPIIHDKMFFFGAYEGLRQQTYTVLSGTAPTQYFIDQATAAQPAYATPLSFLPVVTGDTPTSLSGEFRGPGISRATDSHYDSRIDYHLGERDSVMLRYIYGQPFSFTPKFPPKNGRSYHGVSEEVAASYIHSWTNWSNELRFGFNYSNTKREDLAYAAGLPTVRIKDMFDQRQAEYLNLRGHSYTFNDVLARTIGRHNLKFGMIYVGRAPQRYDQQVPYIQYKTGTDFIALKPNEADITFGTPRYHGRGWELGGFIQDDFQATPRLMLNLGFRWDYYSVFKTKEGLLYNPVSIAGALARPIVFRPHNSLYNADKLNPEPRLGFVYALDPQGRTIVRGGVGIAVAPYNYREFDAFVLTDPDLPASVTLSKKNLSTYDLNYPMTNQQVADKLTGTGGIVGYQTFDPTARSPYSVQWILDFQHQINSRSAFKLGYVGNKGLKIFATHYANLPDRITGISPDPNSLQYKFRSGSDFSWYHALQASYDLRTWNGLQYQLNYTWGRAMAEQGGDFWEGDDFKVQDEQDLRADIGPTKYNIPQRLVGNVIYAMPKGHGDGWRRVRNTALFGWTAAFIFSAQSGSPVDVEQGSTYEESRPDIVPGVNPYAHGLGRFQYINPDAFQALPIIDASGATIRPGNVSKNMLRGPSQWDLDTSLAKTFTLHENLHLLLRAQAFNTLNHVPLGGPRSDMSKSHFGLIDGVGDARTIQLDARIQF